jgi:hypothetical protein
MRRRLVYAVVCAAALVACSEPPTEEREQALGAIAAARAAGAATYAPEEIKAAETALAGYDAAVSQGDFRAALGAAIEARESAYAAARRAADEKAAARSRAEQLLAAVESLAESGASRAGGRAGPRPNPAAATRLRATLTSATAALQKSRALIAAQEYRAAASVLAPIHDALERDLAPASAAPGRRGR